MSNFWAREPLPEAFPLSMLISRSEITKDLWETGGFKIRKQSGYENVSNTAINWKFEEGHFLKPKERSLKSSKNTSLRNVLLLSAVYEFVI